jgi:uncharacterized protein YxjI
MHPSLNRNRFFIKEQVGWFKTSNSYDIYDPESGECLMQCREPRLGFFTKMLRLTKWKTVTPFHVEVNTPSGDAVLAVKRGTSFFVSKVDVLDEDDERVGGFKQKLFSWTSTFFVLGEDDQQLCTLKGKWTSWEFNFEHNGVSLAKVSKKWDGFARQLFTDADTYMLEISDDVPEDNPLRILILASVLCIDMVLSERG